MSLQPVVVQQQSGYGVETALAKSRDSTYYVQNTSTGIVAISQPLQPTLDSVVTGGITCASGQSVELPNPLTGPGLYAVCLDFGATGGRTNVSCVANWGLAGQPEGSDYRWIGGAETSATLSIAGVALDTVQLAPNDTDGTTLVLTNYTQVNIGPGNLTFFQLSSNNGF
jgi:hypothetical protein